MHLNWPYKPHFRVKIVLNYQLQIEASKTDFNSWLALRRNKNMGD